MLRKKGIARNPEVYVGSSGVVAPLAAGRPSQSGWIVGLGVAGVAGVTGLLIEAGEARLLGGLR